MHDSIINNNYNNKVDILGSIHKVRTLEKTEGRRRTVLIATVSEVQACKLYSPFTTYNVQNTVDHLRIGLDMQLY